MRSTLTIDEFLRGRCVQRLCHFTPSRNLPHILHDGQIRSTKNLAEDVRAVYAATDLARFDGFPDRVCCTIEYPNAYYWAKAREQGEARLFPDWVVLLIDPQVARPDTLFCTGNASRGSGSTAQAGHEGLQGLFADSVEGSRGSTFTRRQSHLQACPTDLQAELLISAPIDLRAVQAIVVDSDDQAATEVSRLAQASLPIDSLKWVVAPTFFQPYELARAVRGGRPPREVEWSMRGADQ
jgi:hypothetical protein